ncbi:zinc finger protein 721-like [Pimephales promelas]|nr:zinc finger protein 721-like [Pimephales promelas]
MSCNRKFTADEQKTDVLFENNGDLVSAEPATDCGETSDRLHNENIGQENNKDETADKTIENVSKDLKLAREEEHPPKQDEESKNVSEESKSHGEVTQSTEVEMEDKGYPKSMDKVKDNTEEKDAQSTEGETEDKGDPKGTEKDKDNTEEKEDESKSDGTGRVVKRRKSRLECNECGKKFTRRETYNLHRHFHMHQDEQASLVCKECGITFQHRSDLIKHRSIHKENSQPSVSHSNRSKIMYKERRRFVCEHCGMCFSTMMRLRIHACEQTVEKPFRCPLCRKEFQYRVSINAHMQSHSLDSPYRCLECNKGFQSLGTLHIHQRSHAALKPYECPDCSMVFKHRYVMEDHRRRHMEERAHLCKICGKSFKYSSLLQQHQYLHTGRKPYHCSYCGKAFAFAQNMRAHCRQHKKISARSEARIANHDVSSVGQVGKENAKFEQQRNCPLCPQIFYKASDLRAHMLIHEAEYERMSNGKRFDKVYACQYCPLKFQTESLLQSHSQTHMTNILGINATHITNQVKAVLEKQDFGMDEADIDSMSGGGGLENQTEKKPFRCRDCGKCFRYRSVLELHMRIHNKGYQCQVCKKSFRFSSYLQQHSIIHTGKKPYKCPDCGKDFAFHHNMKTHQRLHQQKPFRCTQCRKGYSDESQLQRHMLSHTGEKPYKCHMCDKSFALAYLLRDHLNTHTGERPHRCQECHKSFPWLSSLLVHQKIHMRKRQAQDVNIDPVSNSKASNARNTGGEMEICPRGPKLKAQDHAEVVGANAAFPPMKIKTEQVEEDECVVVHVDEVEEGDLADIFTSTGDSSERDGSTEGDRPFHCEDCSEAFGNKEDYLEHRSEHIHDGPIVCLDTDSQWDDLLISTDGGRRTLFCALCGQKFSSSKGFFTHQLKHRNQDIKQGAGDGFGEGAGRQKLFECKDCGKAYTTVGQCLNHQRSHKQASKSVFHQLAHLKKKSFQCPTCGRCYSRASALDAHRRCHEVKLVKSKTCETEKPMPLNESPGQTEDNGTSSEQPEGHEQKVFQCFCGKSFRAMCGLSTHKRFSTSCSDGKVKEEIKHSFVCSECGKTFVSSVALLCHQRWHKRRAQLVCNGEPYKCTECGKVFTSLTFYNKHQRLAHSEELPAKSFLHQVIQLKKKAFECPECGRRFSRASALQSHQLCHTDVFGDIMEKKPEMSTATHTLKMNQNDNADSVVIHSVETSHAQVQKKDLNLTDTVEEDGAIDVDYEVVHITASDDYENNSGFSRDQNPDLELCDKSYTTPSGLYNHLKVCSGGAKDEKRKNFNPTKSLLGPKVYHCKKCDHHSKPTETEKRQSEILSADESGPPVKLLYASKKDVAKREKAEVKHFQCSYCDKSFLNIRGLRAHKWQKHHKVSERPTASQEERSAFVKPFASEGPLRKTSSKKELKASTEEDPVQHNRNFEFAKCFFKCDKCAKAFPSEEQLNAHKEVAKTRPHCCALCCRGYWTENQLQHHLAWHNEVRRRLPTELRYRLSASLAPGPSDNQQALSHRSESTVKLPVALVCPQANSHKCQQCGKTFLSPRALQQHQTLHKDEEPYHCSLCSQTFSDLRNLIDHHQECLGDKELKDSSSVSEVRDAANLTCIECGISFKQETELHQHYIEHARGF